MPIIEMPDGTEVEFPDNMPKEQIRAMIQKKFPQESLAASMASKKAPERTGVSGIMGDVAEDLRNVPGAALDFLKNLPSEAFAAGKEVLTDPGRAFRVAGLGAEESVRGTANIPLNLSKYLERKEILPKGTSQYVPSIPETDAKRLLGLEGEPRPGESLLKEFTGLIAPGTLAESMVAKGPRLLQRQAATAAGIRSAGQNEDPISAGILGELGATAGGETARFIKKAPENAKNLNDRYQNYQSLPRHEKVADAMQRVVKTQLSPEELKQRAKVAEGTDTPLHEIIKSPTLKKFYENFAAAAPFSPVNESMRELGEKINNMAPQILEDAFPNIPNVDANELSQAYLQGLKKKQRSVKNKLFDEVDAYEKTSGHQLELPRFRQLSNKVINEIEDSPLLKTQPKVKQRFNRLMGMQQAFEEQTSPIIDPSGKQIKTPPKAPSIKEARIFAADLEDEALKLNRSVNRSDKAKGELFNSLANKIRRDIGESVENFGDAKLKRLDERAVNNYKQNYLGFMDKDISKYFSGEKSPDSFIRDVIRPSIEKDEFTQIKKIQDFMPDEMKNMLGASYLKQGLKPNETITAQHVSKRLNKLGKRQFEALFPEKASRDKILEFQQLKNMNNEALNVMANPGTGKRALQSLMALIEGGAAHAFGATPMGAASVVAPTAISYLTHHLMTDPKIKEAFIKKLIAVEKKKKD